MISDVYVQCTDGIPSTRNLYDCYNGFKIRGHKIIKFESQLFIDNLNHDINDNPILSQMTKNDILCSGIPVFRKIISHLQIPYTELETYPKVLRKFLDRKIGEMTLGGFKEELEKGCIGTYFIKPKQQKLFTGFVVSKRSELLKIVGVDDNSPIYISNIVHFLSEFRIYVNQKAYYSENGIIGCYFYNGDPLILPDPKKIKEIISYYNNNGAPVSYGLDVGIIKKGKSYKTILIEVNSAFCLGNYGLPSTLYVQIIEEGWKQITGI